MLKCWKDWKGVALKVKVTKMLLDVTPSAPGKVVDCCSVTCWKLPPATLQFTWAPLTGLPEASVTLTTMGRNEKGDPSWHWEQMTCPLPLTTERVCALATPAQQSAAITVTSHISL